MLVVQLASFSLQREGLQVSFGGEESVNRADFYLPPPCFTHLIVQTSSLRSFEAGRKMTVLLSRFSRGEESYVILLGSSQSSSWIRPLASLDPADMNK